MATAARTACRARQARSAMLADRLYSEHRGHLLAIARRNSACLEDAEEALQDGFILFIDRFDPKSEAPPLAWLTLTLKRRCWALYQLRRRGWAQGSGRPAEHCSTTEAELASRLGHPVDQLELAEEMAVVRNRLGELKRDERRALSLLAAGFSYREIGEIAGWTYTKVNRCIAEGRAALRSTQSPAG